MPNLHRLQWIDAQVRAGRFPNARTLAAAFEISHRQALRDFEYMRDSLGAPLEYSAMHRGYTYTSQSFALTGAYVTEPELAVLEGMAEYYSTEAASAEPASPAFAHLAGLLRRIGGGRAVAAARKQPVTPERKHLRHFQALLRLEGPSPGVPVAMQPYWRGQGAHGTGVCEFLDTDQFLAALLSTNMVYRIDSPNWLRRRFQARLTKLQQANADMTRFVISTGVPSVQASATQADDILRRDQFMTGTRRETAARFRGSWLSYMGSAYGACHASGLCDLDFIDAYGLSGMAFHMVVHETCCPSSVTTYNWLDDHVSALDRLGILSEVYLAIPDGGAARGWGGRTFDAACRRAVTNIKASIDRGFPVILWGVDSSEFGVVYGYDDADGVLLVSGVFGQGPDGSVPILYENLGRIPGGAPLLHYQVPLERVPQEMEQAHREALADYVSRMERPAQFDTAYYQGLAAYDVWIRALSRPDLSHRGLRYLVYVYYETKDFAAAYVRRLADTYKGWDGIAEVADGFAAVAALYEKMMTVLEQSYEPPPILEQPVTGEQLKALDTLLRDARAKESAALALVKRLLRKG